jgi:hypothetical protein
VYVEGVSFKGHAAGSIHKIGAYHYKRFYQHNKASDNCSCNDIALELSAPKDGEKTLFGFEGSMLPSRTELNLPKKADVDFWSITNLSFMDIAYRMGIKPNLFIRNNAQLPPARDSDLSIEHMMQPAGAFQKGSDQCNCKQ